MKKAVIFSALILAAVTLWYSCSTGVRRSTAVELQFSPHVEAFTSGRISRTAPVFLILAQDADTAAVSAKKLSKAMKIKPDVKGEFSFENGKTIVFRPDGEFARGQSYTITADLGALAGVEGNDKKFSFSFSTYPLALRGNLASFTTTAGKEDTYDIVLDLRSPDREDAATVEGLVKFSESVNATWEHAPDGKKHTLTISAVEAGKIPRYLNLSAEKKSGAEKGEIASVRIPAKGEFGIYDVRYVTEPQKYIEATFTAPLDGKQDMDGLAFIEGEKPHRVTVEGNVMKIYPESGQSGTLKIMFNESIRSSAGTLLNESISFEVETDSDAPGLKIIGDGVIMPSGGALNVPFRAVYLRGVVAKVIRIPENNMGPFFQNNSINESRQLLKVGRLVARKTIFFDPDVSDFTRWGTYAIELRDIIDPEPGALYRLELSYSRELSAYGCDDDYQAPTKEEILAQDELKFRQELDKYDSGYSYSYYYYDYDYDEYDWYYYDYYDRDDPCTESYYYRKTYSKNILATDLGLIVKSEEGGTMLAMVHNLSTTDPVADAEVTVYNYQNMPIGKGRTDASGKARLTVKGGMPYYVKAASGAQRTYVRTDRGDALSLSTFDVSGEVVRKGLKGFIYGERGVWRPGDTLFLSFMVSDRDGMLPADHPVVLELYNPLGQQYVRRVAPKGSYGIYAFEVPTDSDVPTGSWEAKVTVGGVVFSKRLRIESIKPNRLKIDFNFEDDILLANTNLTADFHTEWLQGATARNLKYEINASVTPAKTTFPKYAGYVFDDGQKTFEAEEMQFSAGTTDEKGDARPSGTIRVGKTTPGMLNVMFDTKVYEESGDFSIDVLNKKFSPYKRYVGVSSPQKGKAHLNTKEKHKFDVVSLNYKGEPAGEVRLEVEVYRVGWYWWYSSSEDRLANYFSNSYHRPDKTISLRTDSSGKGSFDLQFIDSEWGTYYIRVKDEIGGHSAGILAYFDWPYLQGQRGSDGAAAASLLSLKTDKQEYNPGDKILLTFPSSEDSRALVSIENGSKVIGVEQHVCDKGETTIAIKADADMMPNAYLHVTLIQPHGNTNNDLPIRLYGVVPVTVTSADSRLKPVINMKDDILPESKYEVTVSEEKGRPMAYTLAIVDEGLLDLTRFPTPDPWKAFNAKEALGVRTWDMYNDVIGAYGGRLEQVFSIGGDDALGSGPKAIVNRFKPVVTFLGPFTLKKGEKQKHTLEMPNYNGRVRVMVVAGDGSAYGHTDKSVMVRRPVMLLGTLPRVIGVNETMVVPATVFATEKGIGDVKVSISCTGNMSVEGSTTLTLNFDKEGDKQAFFTVKTGGTPGAGKVVLTADSKKGKINYDTEIEVRSVSRPVTIVTAGTVAAGQTWSGEVKVPGMDGTNNIMLEASTVPPVNLSSRLQYLIGYPHGCIEQITSKGFPQLYLKTFATLSAEQQRITSEAVKEVISRQRSYQTAEGGFSYWPGGTSTHAWGTIYATHFQLEAELQGYLVPEGMKTSALNNLKLVARNFTPPGNSYNKSSEIVTQAYRLYVLALSGNAETGAMNRLRERSDLTNSAKYYLAAAYAQAGRDDTAKEILSTFKPINDYSYGEYDYTFGSPLRDRAVQLIANVLIGDDMQAAELSRTISDELASDQWMSTQTTAYALMSMSRLYAKYSSDGGMSLDYTCGGEKGKVKSDKIIHSVEVGKGLSGAKSATVSNTGKSSVFLRWIANGIPHAGQEVAYESRVKVSVSYTDLKGNPIDVTSLEQGTNFRATVTVANPTPRAHNNIVITQIFPSGWEILSTRFANEGASDSYPAGVNYQDIRDDRVYSYIDRFPAGRETKITLNLAAIYEGEFHLPPVYAEAMYDNDIRANTEGGTARVTRDR